jgi:ribonuclease HI
MARGGGAKFYAVAHGRNIGVFGTWDECKAQVDGFTKAMFKSFATKSEADAYVSSRASAAAPVNLVPQSAQRRTLSVTDRDRPARSPPAAFLPRQDAATPPGAPHPSRAISSPAPQQSRENATLVFVDGSCLGNGQGGAARGGYGGFYGNNDSRNFSEPLLSDERQTNNRGELKAAIHAIRHASESRSLTPLHIYTDSRYVIDGITKWIVAWRKKDYAKVENDDLWRELDATLQRQSLQYAHGTGGKPADAVMFHHVKGHSGVYGNEQADRLAVMGSMKALQQNKR